MQSDSFYPILLFDGDCSFCNRTVQWVWKRNRKKNIRFASLDSKTAHAICTEHGLPAFDKSSLIWVENGKIYRSSDAALRCSRQLRRGWPLLMAFWIVPRFIRDGVYRLIARNRHRITRACPLPPPGMMEHVLP